MFFKISLLSECEHTRVCAFVYMSFKLHRHTGADTQSSHLTIHSTQNGFQSPLLLSRFCLFRKLCISFLLFLMFRFLALMFCSCEFTKCILEHTDTSTLSHNHHICSHRHCRCFLFFLLLLLLLLLLLIYFSLLFHQFFFHYFCRRICLGSKERKKKN